MTATVKVSFKNPAVAKIKFMHWSRNGGNAHQIQTTQIKPAAPNQDCSATFTLTTYRNIISALALDKNGVALAAVTIPAKNSNGPHPF